MSPPVRSDFKRARDTAFVVAHMAGCLVRSVKADRVTRPEALRQLFCDMTVGPDPMARMFEDGPPPRPSPDFAGLTPDGRVQTFLEFAIKPVQELLGATKASFKNNLDNRHDFCIVGNL